MRQRKPPYLAPARKAARHRPIPLDPPIWALIVSKVRHNPDPWPPAPPPPAPHAPPPHPRSPAFETIPSLIAPFSGQFPLASRLHSKPNRKGHSSWLQP